MFQVEVFWVMTPYVVAVERGCFGGPSYRVQWYHTATLHSVTTHKTSSSISLNISHPRIIGFLGFDSRWRLGIFFHHRVEDSSGAHPFSYPMGISGSFLESKAAGE
jgi:hypothetical protein